MGWPSAPGNEAAKRPVINCVLCWPSQSGACSAHARPQENTEISTLTMQPKLPHHLLQQRLSARAPEARTKLYGGAAGDQARPCLASGSKAATGSQRKLRLRGSHEARAGKTLITLGTLGPLGNAIGFPAQLSPWRDREPAKLQTVLETFQPEAGTCQSERETRIPTT